MIVIYLFFGLLPMLFTLRYDRMTIKVRASVQEHVELKLLTKKIIRRKQNYYGTIIQKYRYRVSPNFGSKSIADTTIDIAFENYRRYCDRYRKSIGDTADTDTLSPILTTLLINS